MSLRRTALVALVCAGCCAEPVRAQQPAISRVADSLIAAGFEGVVLTGDATGRRVGIASGRARRAPRVDHSEARAWPWASVTKQITAILIMTEVERGTLTLTTTLGEALPRFRSARTAGITIRQLLQHTSGLPNPDAGTPDDQMPRAYTRRAPSLRAIDEATLLCSGPVTRTAGEAFEYNNCDYIVLGAILEARTKQSFASLVRTRIAEPLGLRSLRMAPRTVTTTPGIIGYRGDGEAPRANLATFGASGSLIGTPDDLLQFDLALMSGRLLRPAPLAELWKGEPKLGYAALGAWAFPATLAGCDGEIELVERRGDIGGVQVRNLIAPARKQALVIFTNRGDYEFGEIWQGAGATWALASAAFCGASAR